MPEINHGPAVHDRCYGHKNPEFDYPAWHDDRVPKTVRILVGAKSCFPVTPVLSVSKGEEYPAWVNRHGAVSAILPNGERLGLYPHEFEVAEYLDQSLTNLTTEGK